MFNLISVNGLRMEAIVVNVEILGIYLSGKEKTK